MMRLIKLIFFCLVIFSPLKAIESYIVLKVDNEIITNIDLETEYKYLLVLNGPFLLLVISLNLHIPSSMTRKEIP